MIIRRLESEDLTGLADLYKQFWNEDSSLDKMQEKLQTIKDDPNYILLVAEVENGLAGSAMGIVCEELYGECRPFMVIEDVIVDKTKRRMGIASSLMKELEKRAREHDCGYIIFVTESERRDAHRFYESLGYDSSVYKGFKKRFSAGW